MQTLDAEATCAWVESYLSGRAQPMPKAQRARDRAVRRVLTWLAQHPGSTWDERWISSGMDAAPNGGIDVIALQTGLHRRIVSIAVMSLVEARTVPALLLLAAASRALPARAVCPVPRHSRTRRHRPVTGATCI